MIGNVTVVHKIINTSFIKKDPRDLTFIISSVQNVQILRIGAIIVFERNVGLRNIIESGTILNSKISTSLLLTIFSNKTPLHDGAVIIKNDVIIRDKGPYPIVFKVFLQ